MTADNILFLLKKNIRKEKAAFFPRFFKTGPGDYGEGDLFIGVTVPDIRKVVRHARGQLSRKELARLIRNPIHEVRLAGLLLLADEARVADKKNDLNALQEIKEFYIRNIDGVNNWDLVDLSAKDILGPWFWRHDRTEILKLAASENLWHERIAVLTTFYFIKKGDCTMTFQLAEDFLTHKHDLIHKAVGWMLRECGKQNTDQLRSFLERYATRMPRTMLRYAIEKFPDAERQYWLKKK